MKSSTSSVGVVTSLPSPAIQSVRLTRLLVARMRADQVGVVDLGVVDVLRPDCIWVWIFSTTSPSWMMSWLTLMPVISREGLGQHLGLVLVRGDGLGDDVDLHALEGLRGLDEPLHLLHLLVLGQRRRLELVVDPLLRRASSAYAGDGDRPRTSAMAMALAVVDRQTLTVMHLDVFLRLCDIA